MDTLFIMSFLLLAIACILLYIRFKFHKPMTEEEIITLIATAINRGNQDIKTYNNDGWWITFENVATRTHIADLNKTIAALCAHLNIEIKVQKEKRVVEPEKYVVVKK